MFIIFLEVLPTCMHIKGYKTNFPPNPSSAFSWCTSCYSASKVQRFSPPSYLGLNAFLRIGS